MDKKMKIGFVGYIQPDQPDFWENAKILADVGYQGMEGAGRMLDDPDGLDKIKRLRDIGLEPLTVSTDIDYLTRRGQCQRLRLLHPQRPPRARQPCDL